MRDDEQADLVGPHLALRGQTRAAALAPSVTASSHGGATAIACAPSPTWIFSAGTPRASASRSSGSAYRGT